MKGNFEWNGNVRLRKFSPFFWNTSPEDEREAEEKTDRLAANEKEGNIEESEI